MSPCPLQKEGPGNILFVCQDLIRIVGVSSVFRFFLYQVKNLQDKLANIIINLNNNQGNHRHRSHSRLNHTAFLWSDWAITIVGPAHVQIIIYQRTRPFNEGLVASDCLAEVPDMINTCVISLDFVHKFKISFHILYQSSQTQLCTYYIDMCMSCT